MKNFKFLALILLGISLNLLGSCSKGDPSPVDQFVELIDQATDKIESINNIEQVQEVQDMAANQKARELEQQYAGYQLTDKDKEKLKKSMTKFINVVYDKTLELAGFPNEVVQEKKKQVKLITDQMESKIDQASTLGEIGGL